LITVIKIVIGNNILGCAISLSFYQWMSSWSGISLASAQSWNTFLRDKPINKQSPVVQQVIFVYTQKKLKETVWFIRAVFDKCVWIWIVRAVYCATVSSMRTCKTRKRELKIFAHLRSTKGVVLGRAVCERKEGGNRNSGVACNRNWVSCFLTAVILLQQLCFT
jgi:hypothetical protein